ncbi:MAG TPA: hypothetical protein VGH28_07910 [Polyangiaceae bacterium]
MRSVIVSLAVLAAGCYNGYPTLPPQLAEGTEILAPGSVDLNVAAGAGEAAYPDTTGKTTSQFAAGFEARLRTGLGAKSELGASLFGGGGTSVANGDPPFAIGGKLSYKIAPVSRFAIIVDGGAMDFRVSSTAVFSGDLALVFAPYMADDGKQLYVGAKGAFTVPVLQGATATGESIVIPIGFELPTSKRVRFIVEAGPIFGFGQQSTPSGSLSTNGYGGYATLAFTFLLR